MAKKANNRKTTQTKKGDSKIAKYGDQTVTVGTGGETHQTALGDTPVLTTQQGFQYRTIKTR